MLTEASDRGQWALLLVSFAGYYSLFRPSCVIACPEDILSMRGQCLNLAALAPWRPADSDNVNAGPSAPAATLPSCYELTLAY